ncbi:mammalian cell entry protein, partial [Mycobacterium sp. CBMA295]|nr:mammalian cell entry protein [Mycolicibacterium sp. CBMA 295]
GVAPPGAQQMLPGGSYVPPNMPNTVSDMLNPVGPQPGPLPAEAAAPAAPLPAEGTPPA